MDCGLIHDWTARVVGGRICGMVIIRSAGAWEWGALDLPLQGIRRDWHGVGEDTPAMYALAVDPRCLWFVAGHARRPSVHPGAEAGEFCAGLWRHDVAELFLADPATSRYWEWNLAANGAWWSCRFVAPRVRATAGDEVPAGVVAHADWSAEGGWLAALAIPLELLREWLSFGPGTTGNVTFILGSPAQRFFTAADLGSGEPDFHRPERFAVLDWRDDLVAGK